MIISSSLCRRYGSLRGNCLEGSEEETADTGLGFGAAFTTGRCSGNFTFRVRAIDVPEIVAAGRFLFGVPRLFELGGLRKLDKNIYIDSFK